MANDILTASQQQEVVITAVAEGKKTAAELGTMSAKDKAKHEIADELRETVRTKRDARDAFKRMEEIDEEAIQKASGAIEQNIGRFKADGSMEQRDKREAKRHGKAKRLETLAKDLTEHGWDGMTPEQQKQLRLYMRNAATQFPALKNILENLPPDEQARKIDEWLKDERIAQRMLGKFVDKANATELDDEISQATRARNAKEAVAKAAGERRDDNIKRLGEVHDELAKFEDDVPKGSGNKGEYKVKLEEYDQNRGVWQGNIDRAEAEIKKQNSKLSNLQLELSATYTAVSKGVNKGRTTEDIQQEMDGINDLIAAQQRIIGENNKRLAIKAELDTKRAELIADRNKREADAPNLKLAADQAQSEYLIEAATVTQKTTEREKKEELYVAGLERVFVDVMAETFKEDFDDHAVAMTERMDKLVAAAEKEPEKKAVLEELKIRYKTVDVTGSKPKIEYQRDQIDKDYKNLLKYGPDYIVQHLLGKQFNDLSITDDRDRILDRLKKAEEFMRNNPDAVDALRNNLVEGLLSAKLRTGKIEKAEALLIADTKWGEKAVESAIAHNKALDDQVKAMRESGKIKDTADFVQKVKIHGAAGGFGLAALMMLIFGLPLAAGAAVTAAGGIELGRMLSSQ